MRNRLIVMFLALAFSSADAASSNFTVSVTNPTFRFITAGVPAAGYLTIRNHTGVPIVLTGARSPGCRAITMHQSLNEGGMSRMIDVPSLSIAVHQEVRFQPGGYHLMCMNPTPIMTSAKTVGVTLLFACNHPVTVNFHLTDARGIERP